MHWRPGGQQPARAGPYRRRRHRAYRRGHLPDGPGRRLSARSTRRAPWAQRTGIAHNLAAIPVFFGLPAALACSRRSWRTGQRAFALYSTGTAITMLTHHDAGRGRLRPVTLARQSRVVPGRQHHHRLLLAHNPFSTRTSAFTRPRLRRSASGLNTLLTLPETEAARSSRPIGNSGLGHRHPARPRARSHRPPAPRLGHPWRPSIFGSSGLE